MIPMWGSIHLGLKNPLGPRYDLLLKVSYIKEKSTRIVLYSTCVHHQPGLYLESTSHHLMVRKRISEELFKFGSN
jgi:hypothetical protein